jgi:hypothetical protein
VEFDSYLGKGVKVSPKIQLCVGPISHFYDVFFCWLVLRLKMNAITTDGWLVLAQWLRFSAGLIQSIDRTRSTCGCAVGLIFHFLSCPLFLLFWERTPWHHMRLFVTLHDAFMSIIDGEP